MTKQVALTFIRDQGQSENIVKHLISVGAAMRTLALHFHEDHDGDDACGGVINVQNVHEEKQDDGCDRAVSEFLLSPCPQH